MNLGASASFVASGNPAMFCQDFIQPAMVAAATDGITLIENQAKQYCPVRTGELRDSITSRTDQTNTGVVAQCGPTAFYGPYVEFGTGRRGEASPGHGEGPYKQSWPGMVAQPYMRPSLDENTGPVLDQFRTQIGAVLNG